MFYSEHPFPPNCFAHACLRGQQHWNKFDSSILNGADPKSDTGAQATAMV